MDNIDPHTTTEDFYDQLEPDELTNQYREAATRLLPIIEKGVAHCLAAKNTALGRMQIKYALGLEHRPMRQVATHLGVTVACISRGAREFIDANRLPVPPCMKSKEATESYRKARIQQLKQ